MWKNHDITQAVEEKEDEITISRKLHDVTDFKSDKCYLSREIPIELKMSNSFSWTSIYEGDLPGVFNDGTNRRTTAGIYFTPATWGYATGIRLAKDGKCYVRKGSKKILSIILWKASRIRAFLFYSANLR